MDVGACFVTEKRLQQFNLHGLYAKQRNNIVVHVCKVNIYSYMIHVEISLVLGLKCKTKRVGVRIEEVTQLDPKLKLLK